MNNYYIDYYTESIAQGKVHPPPPRRPPPPSHHLPKNSSSSSSPSPSKQRRRKNPPPPPPPPKQQQQQQQQQKSRSIVISSNLRQQTPQKEQIKQISLSVANGDDDDDAEDSNESDSKYPPTRPPPIPTSPNETPPARVTLPVISPKHPKSHPDENTNSRSRRIPGVVIVVPDDKESSSSFSSPIEELQHLILEAKTTWFVDNSNVSLPKMEGTLLTILSLVDVVSEQTFHRNNNNHHHFISRRILNGQQQNEQQQQQQQHLKEEQDDQKLAWIFNEVGLLLSSACDRFPTLLHSSSSSSAHRHSIRVNWKQQELKMFQSALNINERLYQGRDSLNWAMSITNVAMTMIELNEDEDDDSEEVMQNLEEGIELLKIAVAMQRRMYQKNLADYFYSDDSGIKTSNDNNKNPLRLLLHSKKFETAREFAVCLRETGQTCSRLGLFQDAIDFFKEHLDVVLTMVEEEGRRWKNRQDERKRRSRSRSRSPIHNIENDDDGKNNQDVNQKKTYKKRNGKQEQEQINKNEDLEEEKQFRREQNAEIAAALNHLGYCYYEAGRHQEGIKFHLEALNLLREEVKIGIRDENDSDLAKLMNNCGFYLTELSFSSSASSSISYNEEEEDDEKHKEPTQKQQREEGFALLAESIKIKRRSLLLLAKGKPVTSETFAVMLWNCGLQFEKWMREIEFRGGDEKNAVEELLYLDLVNEAYKVHSEALEIFKRIYSSSKDKNDEDDSNNNNEWIARSLDKVGKLMRVKASLMKETLGMI